MMLILVSAGAGVFGGLLAGLLGVGGGIVIVPALYFALSLTGMEPDLTIRIAVGTSLATIIFTSLSSARAHHKRGAIDFQILRYWAPSIAIGVVIGSLLGGFVSGQLMLGVFALTAFAVAMDMIMRNPAPREAPRQFPGAVWFSLGGAAGIVSAMMGIGGGTVCVPMLSFLGYDIRRAVGTASVIGLVIAIPGAAGYVFTGLGVPGRLPYSIGYVNLVAVVAIIPLTVTMAPLGARLAHAIPRRALRLAFGSFLLITSLRMLWDIL
ncbi:sulfite exporter TauE/SafE family protein [Sulfitobacter sp. F26204]|nr:sulfite exporter TauE/SafE family protein [Sulfitobacter sp. F26204]